MERRSCGFGLAVALACLAGFMIGCSGGAHERVATATTSQALSGDELTVIYDEILQRAPDAAAAAWFGRPYDQARAGVAFSAESAANVNTAYNQILCRDAEPAGMQYWQQFMADGATLDDVRGGIYASEERGRLEALDACP
jgi:hypothetical protein